MKANLVEFNDQRLKQLGQPICRSRAINKPAAASSANDDVVQSLMNDLYLAHGARVMLVYNLLLYLRRHHAKSHHQFGTKGV